MSTCRSCSAEIRWETTEAGKAIPLDPEPRADGNVDVVFIGGEQLAVVLGPHDAVTAQAAGHQLYVTHFSTCPSAGAWRRRSAAAEPRNGVVPLTKAREVCDSS